MSAVCQPMHGVQASLRSGLNLPNADSGNPDGAGDRHFLPCGSCACKLVNQRVKLQHTRSSTWGPKSCNCRCASLAMAISSMGPGSTPMTAYPYTRFARFCGGKRCFKTKKAWAPHRARLSLAHVSTRQTCIRTSSCRQLMLVCAELRICSHSKQAHTWGMNFCRLRMSMS